MTIDLVGDSRATVSENVRTLSVAVDHRARLNILADLVRAATVSRRFVRRPPTSDFLSCAQLNGF